MAKVRIKLKVRSQVMISLIKTFYIIMIVKFIIHLFCYYHVYVDISDYIMQNSILKYVAAKSRQAGKHTDIKLHIHMHVCMHTHTHTHTHAHTHTHTYYTTCTQSKAKAKPTAAIRNTAIAA